MDEHDRIRKRVMADVAMYRYTPRPKLEYNPAKWKRVEIRLIKICLKKHPAGCECWRKQVSISST